ncbi:MAG: TonB-dependent receptor [Bacteroidota bacterium]
MQADKLTIADLNYTNEDPGNQRVLSASRSLKSINDLPFTVHVVSREEIFENGYTTLVDVLKSVPGIRVSQPGSGLDGETFLMRGLYGNTYAKILINDIPIKSTGAIGMPLGAQLPIRQAERIEIIYGPSAAIYGSDAAAGVINIVLKNSDRPIYTRADLGLGQFSYTDLNVLFGGKIGRGKRILNFSFYGSNTQYDDRKTLYDRNTLYNPVPYADGDLSYVTQPTNYRGRTPEEPDLDRLPHLSRMIGVNLEYRALRFSYHKMYRRDHSATGLNPLAVSYINPLNYIGETIDSYHLKLSKDYKKLGYSLNLTYLNYQIDNRSSHIFVRNTLWRFQDAVIDRQNPTPTERNELRNWVYNRYFQGNRFTIGRTADVAVEPIFTLHAHPAIEWVFGGRLSVSRDLPTSFYYGRSVTLDQFSLPRFNNENDAPIDIQDASFYTAGAFSQIYISLKRLTLITGMRYDYHEQYDGAFSPRIATLFKITPRWSIRGSFATAFRFPSTFYDANTFFLDEQNIESLVTRQDTTLNIAPLNPERTFNFEFGSRWSIGRTLSADIVFFYSQTRNFISYNFDQNPIQLSGSNRFALGYSNDDDSNASVYGIQSNLVLQNILPRYRFYSRLSLNFSRGEETLPFGKGRLDQPRMQPRFLGQLDISFKPGRKLFFNIKNTFMSDWTRRFVLDEGNARKNSGYYTVDLLTRVELSRNFQIYIRIINLFNNRYGGLGASGFVDDLFYNPQLQRTAQLGLSYLLD